MIDPVKSGDSWPGDRGKNAARYSPAYLWPRRYLIPSDRVRRPTDNGIAVRLYRHVSQEVCLWNGKFARDVKAPRFEARAGPRDLLLGLSRDAAVVLRDGPATLTLANRSKPSLLGAQRQDGIDPCRRPSWDQRRKQSDPEHRRGHPRQCQSIGRAHLVQQHAEQMVRGVGPE